jgi:hypothetical protein
LPTETSRCTTTFLCHINNVGDGKGDECCRQRGVKRATARAKMAMTTAMRVVGDEEGEGSKAIVTATRVVG